MILPRRVTRQTAGCEPAAIERKPITEQMTCNGLGLLCLLYSTSRWREPADEVVMNILSAGSRQRLVRSSK